MNKKNKILLIIILLLIALFIMGKLFYSWWLEKEYLGYIPAKEFSIKEIENKKIITHKGAKLKMEIPIGWQIEKTEISLLFSSPDFQSSPETDDYYFYELKKGCITEISIMKKNESGTYKIEYDDLQARINLCLDSPEQCKGDHPDKIIKINGYNALEFTYIPKDNSENSLASSGKHVFVVIPKNESIYAFETYLFSEDKERCEQEFNKFLETVVIE